MLDKIFPNVKQAAFVLLAVALGIAALFGYADWQPSPDQSEWISAVVEFVKAILTLWGAFYIGRRVERL